MLHLLLAPLLLKLLLLLRLLLTPLLLELLLLVDLLVLRLRVRARLTVLLLQRLVVLELVILRLIGLALLHRRPGLVRLIEIIPPAVLAVVLTLDRRFLGTIHLIARDLIFLARLVVAETLAVIVHAVIVHAGLTHRCTRLMRIVVILPSIVVALHLIGGRLAVIGLYAGIRLDIVVATIVLRPGRLLCAFADLRAGSRLTVQGIRGNAIMLCFTRRQTHGLRCRPQR